ncbi:MAG: hypothetical protein HY390_04845 [Deltaproteobacteria bacterium]|nr:hypothetical protein [Deltaproteobacteria bacterium]
MRKKYFYFLILISFLIPYVASASRSWEEVQEILRSKKVTVELDHATPGAFEALLTEFTGLNFVNYLERFNDNYTITVKVSEVSVEQLLNDARISEFDAEDSDGKLDWGWAAQAIVFGLGGTVINVQKAAKNFIRIPLETSTGVKDLLNRLQNQVVEVQWSPSELKAFLSYFSEIVDCPTEITTTMVHLLWQAGQGVAIRGLHGSFTPAALLFHIVKSSGLEIDDQFLYVYEDKLEIGETLGAY